MREIRGSDKPGLFSKLLAALGMIFLLLPLVAIVPVSFTSKRFLSMPEGSLSLRHYIALVTEPTWIDAIKLSLGIGVTVSLISTVVAVMFGIGIWYVRNTFGTILAVIVFLPMATPPVVSSLILYFFGTSISKFAPVIGFDSVGGVIIAHVILATPFALVSFMVALSRLDRKFDLASQGMGASLWQTIFWVIIPNTKFGITTAAFLAFILSWEEIAVTLFITSFGVNTLPRQIWNGMRDNIDPAIAALSVVLIAITAMGVFIADVVKTRNGTT